jgi:hypothetical protein
MDESQIKLHLAEYAAHYPSFLSINQAAAIGQVKTKTIYHWSSLGLLDGFKSKRGRHVRLSRDAFVRFLAESSDQPTP